MESSHRDAQQWSSSEKRRLCVYFAVINHVSQFCIFVAVPSSSQPPWTLKDSARFTHRHKPIELVTKI